MAGGVHVKPLTPEIGQVIDDTAAKAATGDRAARFDLSEMMRNPKLQLYARAKAHELGLDLADIAPRLTAAGLNIVPEGAIDPWGVQTAPVSKPVVVAVKGTCFTLGIELILAADIAVAADNTTFAQLEVQRGILPFGGATLRFASRCGWGNAMRWMLTGDTFTADQAASMGLVQEVVDVADVEVRALEVAQRIAAAAPLAVSATLRNARLAARATEQAAISQLQPELVTLMQSHDARLAFESYLTKVPPVFEGR
jgi:hypothetical protein